MSYFKNLYFRIKNAGFNVQRFKCKECGRWDGPVGFDGNRFTVICKNPKCPEYEKEKRYKAKRGYS
jgi:hypothetical protein